MDREKKRGHTKPLSAAPLPPAKGDKDRQLQAILQQSPLILYTLDQNGIVTLMEGRDIEPDLLNTEDMIGRSIYDLSGIFEVPDIDIHMKKVLGGEDTRFVIQVGDQFFEAHSTPLRGDKGIEGVIGVAYEVTRWKKAKEATQESHAVSSAILDDIEDGYYEVDLRGNFTLINSALANILGCEKADLMDGKLHSFRAFTDEVTAENTERAFNHVYRTGKPVRALEGKVSRGDGSTNYVELSISVRRDAEDQPIGFRGIVRDVTDRKAVEDALAQRMVLLSVLQQVDNELNHTLEVEKVLKVALNAAMVLSGAETGFIGMINDDMVRVVRVAGTNDEQTYATGVPAEVGVTGRAMRLRQAQRVIDVSIDPDYIADIPDTQAEIAIPLIMHDKLLGVINLETSRPEQFTEAVFEYVQMLTARVASAIENARLYEISQEQLGAMRELEQLKTDMIRIASHDLRSPLGIILGYLDILTFDLEAVLTDEQRGYMDAIRRAGERIQRMSTEILSLERVNALRNQPRVPVSLNEMVLKAIVEHRDAARQNDINLITQLDTTPMEVMADATSLPEAIANLVSNAIKYTLPGGFVTVRLARESRNLAIFEVIDTGVGIREESQSRLFEPFYRVKSEETAKIDGTGLGLYLVKRIVEQHGGTLRFSSKHGEGSRFGFTLPLVAEVDMLPEKLASNG